MEKEFCIFTGKVPLETVSYNSMPFDYFKVNFLLGAIIPVLCSTHGALY